MSLVVHLHKKGIFWLQTGIVAEKVYTAAIRVLEFTSVKKKGPKIILNKKTIEKFL